MAIAVRASGSVTYDVSVTGTVGQTVTKPAAVVAGDVAVAVVSVGWGSAGPITITVPTGWTAVASNVGSTGSTNSQTTSLFYRVIQAGDSTWSFTHSSTTTARDFGIVFQAFTGVNNTTPIDATGTTATNAGSATISVPAVTIATANALELIGMGCWNGGAASATGFTDLHNGAPATHEQADLLYNTTPKSTGSTGTVTVTQGTASGNQLSAIPFALRPSAGAAQDPIGVASDTFGLCIAMP